MIVGPEILTYHPPKELNGEPRKFVLSECGDNRAPSGDRLVERFIECEEGAEGKLALGVEVDEVRSKSEKRKLEYVPELIAVSVEIQSKSVYYRKIFFTI
ncbi:hypothetical protein SAY87_017698 [Trapa incisa]|uniref:Uncharacterized protein n=1 Tax=Trapa incisa TaxID=236973 RepID=A0AAN7QUH6_9MYRT|nr:hypothetical protein SAY87_017698 [Trapa incisa]